MKFSRQVMSRAHIVKTTMLTIREGRRLQRGLNSVASACEEEEENSINVPSKGGGRMDDGSSCWVPHPRTGIYFPKGHEKLMDDVSDNGASLRQTYWLRNVDGVEKPDHDFPTDHFLYINIDN